MIELINKDTIQSNDKITQVPTTQSDDNYEYYCSISVYALKMRPRKQEGAGAGAGAAGTGTGTQVDTQREPIPLYPVLVYNYLILTFQPFILPHCIIIILIYSYRNNSRYLSEDFMCLFT